MQTGMSRLRKLNRRMLWCSLALGIVFAAFTVIGCDMLDSRLNTPWWQQLLLFALYTVGYTAACMGLMALFEAQSKREPQKQTFIGRIAGNGFLVFVLLIVCWVPVWLAFWPGTFTADSLTQFESFYNEDPSAHHPLLHTAFLGSCMTYGVEMDPEAHATNGLALYSAIQMVLLAACLAYGCHWLKRRGAPVWVRIVLPLFFALFPFYPPWAFNAQKDVLFGALVLVFCLQLLDLWKFGMKPVRLIFFVLITVLMLLFRNNGIYALALAVPLAVWWARKGKRLKMAALLLGSIILYLVINNTAIALLEARPTTVVEMLTVPLQGIGRTLRDHPEAIELDEDGLLETLYGEGELGEIYHPQISDPVRWAIDYDSVDENLKELILLWARVAIRYPQANLEAFLEENLPYYLPCSEMLYNIDIAWIKQHEWFPIVPYSYFPRLRAVYETYDASLNFLNIPGVKLLSHPAFYIWLSLFGLAYGIYSRQGGFVAAFAFLAAIWLTCILGPVAIMRYVLGLYDAVPVLLGAMLIRRGPKAC